MLKTRNISASATSPADWSQGKTFGTSQVRSIFRAIPGGRTRGGFSIRPPPVMWAIAWTVRLTR